MSAEPIADRFRDAELAYACAVLHVATSEVVAGVETDQITDPVARAVHAAALALLATGAPVDPITVTRTLADSAGVWQREVPEVYTHPGAVPANWRHYAGLVREGDYRRRAVAAAERIIQAAETSTTERLAQALAEAGQVVA